MFNFKTLKLTKRCDSESTNSFVGIRRNVNGEVEFRLPHGFDDFPTDNLDPTKNDFEATKELFFKMYRTFKKFERDSTREIVDPRSNGKDQIQKEKDGYRFKNKEDNDVVLYSKIALIENLLEVYRDLALDQMERRIGADEKVDYSKIDRYLDRAIYLPNDVIYIDEMDLPRQTLRYESTTLIDLFCFIVSELQNELEQDIEPRVQELAHRFSEQHLSHEESLFNEETFETTIRTLKGILDDIDKRTAYKDEDYWRLYEAIETFLYGELDMENPDENGIYWGIKDFSSVWEDMCSTYHFAKNFDDVLYADANIIFNGQRVANTKSAGYFPIYKKEDFEDPFFIELRGKRRWMRPDFIEQNELGYTTVLDWKYMDADFFYQDYKKLKTDISKQLCYEFSLKKLQPDTVVYSDFIIPQFYVNPNNLTYRDGDYMKYEVLQDRIRNNKLQVYKIDFSRVQQIYLTHD
ncbi:MAG: hypothetical protein PHN45_12095 [Methylococcales bacterium]|nr:hypothetical protein [Methylococcales bacterium]MDD5755475.1 hypothetical protein [Methylococcales bacterium]